MHYLITGGAGFIGSALAEKLLARGDTVAIIDDLSTGSIRNIEHLKPQSRFHYQIGTIMDGPLLAELVDGADCVFHLAAAVGVRLIVESPVRTIETNVGGTEMVLAAASKKKKKVLVTSTSEVYGKSVDVPFCEDGDLVMGATTRGRWSYACSKAIEEFLAIAYWRERHTPTVIARLFNTIGPRQTGQYGMVVPRFVDHALRGETIPVYGDGTQSRCFTHVDDAVRAIVALMDADHTVGEVYNIGSQREISILDLAKRVRELTGSHSDIAFVPYEEAYTENFEDMARRVPSLDKIKAAVGYEPRIDLDQMLRSIIDFHRAIIQPA